MDARPRLLTRPFMLAFATSFATGLTFHGFLHLPGFLYELGAREVQIGAIVGTMGVTSVLARPMVGRLMDTRGRRVVLIAGAALTTVACALYLTVSSIGPWLYAIRMIHGLAGAAMFPVLFTIAVDIVPEIRLTEGIALFGVSGMLPMSIGGLAGDAILSVGGYDDLFAALAAMALLAFFVSLAIADSRPPPALAAPPRQGFLRALSQADLRPLWILAFAFAVVLAAYFTFLKTYVVTTGRGSVGLFFTAYAAAAIGLRVLLGWVPDRVGRKVALVPSVLCAAAGAVVLSTGASHATVLSAGVLCGVGHGYAFPILSSLVATRTAPSERGSAMAMFTTVFDLGMLVGNPALGAVVRLTSYGTMYLGAAGVLTLALVAFAWTDRGR